MTNQRNTQPNQNAGMRPTNSQVGGPGEFGSSPAQNGNQSRFDGNPSNNGYDASQQPTQQQQGQPPPVHPSRAGQGNQYSQGPGQNQNVSAASGASRQNQYDQSANQQSQDQYRNQQPNQGVSGNDQSGGAMRPTEVGAGADNSGYDQNLNQNQPHTLDRRGHRGPGAEAHAVEAGAVYEGEKLAHGGHHDGTQATQQHQRQDGFGTGGPNQDRQFAAQQDQGVTGGIAGQHHAENVCDAAGQHHAGVNAPVRAAEAGAAYEGGKLAHGGHHDGAHIGQQHHNQNQNEFGTGPDQAGQFGTQQGQGVTGDAAGQHHAGVNAPVRAAEAGAAYEGGKLAHGGHHDGARIGQQQHQNQNEFGTGPDQGGRLGTQQGQGVTGDAAGQHHAGGNAPVRAAEAGAAYEGGKLAHGGHHTGAHGTQQQQQNQHGFGTGPNQGSGPDSIGATPNLGQTAGRMQQHPTGVGAGTAATAGGLAGAAHPGAGHGIGHGTGAYDQQPGGTATTGAAGPTSTAPGTGPGTTTGARGGITGPSVALGQANVVLGKLQQAGGMLLHDDTMRSKGLEREAKGVAKEDRKEATRLEGKAQARREKADGVYASGGPASANAGVDPTAGTHGRNL
ncbi:hypothetical protein ACEPAF_1356 [Sanghuangporus sanghuang]